ncbi:MAG: nucleoside triphosphate pyrophosphohydrolase family protein [Clostridia bacterium]|nr:nucleoside triphosphate pyrophosphohydrolase family protein [Clostridia bacterium]
MQLNEYQALAQRTSNTELALDKLTNGLLGLFGEGGECSDIVKKYMFQEHELDKDHLREELGDVLWYVAEVASGLGVTLEAIATENIAKLESRYPKHHFEGERSRMRGECK